MKETTQSSILNSQSSILNPKKRPREFSRGACKSRNRYGLLLGVLLVLGLALLDDLGLGCDGTRLGDRGLDGLGTGMGDTDHHALRIVQDLDPLGRLQILDPQVVVMGEWRDVDFDRVGNGVRQALHVKLADLKV